ncbi:MAG: FHA domain-containing protein [Planctomycetaceae bacterium]
MAASSKVSQASVTSGADSSAGHVPPPVLFLDVRRGATRVPRRPFPIGRFLIGSGAQCDVRLGGDDMPLLHSILRTDGRDVLLEAVAGNPPLIVNGVATDSAHLQNGDVVAIGTFEFVVECAKTVEIAAPAPTASAKNDADEAHGDALDDVAAAELIERIEAELNEIEEFESRRLLGAGALLQAALERASLDEGCDDTREPAGQQPSLRIAGSTSGSTDETNAELDEIIARLDGFSSQLESRSQRLAEREAKYLEAAAELLKSQQRLAANLDLLQKQIESLGSDEPKPLRASA